LTAVGTVAGKNCAGTGAIGFQNEYFL